MGRLGSVPPVGVVCVVALATGCGSDQIAPPPGLKAVTTSESTAPSKTIFMVLTGTPDQDMETYSMSAQREAGLRRAIFRLAGPGPGDPPSKQGEAIRKSVGDGADVLVVVPNDDPETASALAEVGGKGVSIVLVGGHVAPAAAKLPYTRVAPEPFEATARLLVEAALADARKHGRPGDGEALILSNRQGDLYAADRVAALKAAAEAARCRKVEIVTFDGNPADALKGILDTARSRPDLSIILADGDEGMELAIKARKGLKGQPMVFVAGYAGIHGSFSGNPFFNESAFVEFRPDNLFRLAIRTALARSSGEQLEPIVTLESKFNRGSGAETFDTTTMELLPKRRALDVSPEKLTTDK